MKQTRRSPGRTTRDLLQGRRKRTSVVEVANISKHGFWLLIEDKERFVPFKEFPFFQNAAIGEILNVELASPRHLYWPDLDVDLAVESIDFPKLFPLVSKQRAFHTAGQSNSAWS